ncbi:MAG TPA: hypothetical protein VFH67_03085, partial [bacterium]|nr:hypothetical protein [bacterium]
VLLFLLWAIKGMRRFGALGLWLCGWGLFFAQMKQGFVMLHPPAAEWRRVEGTTRGKHPPRERDPLGVDPDTADPFTPYRLRV